MNSKGFILFGDTEYYGILHEISDIINAAENAGNKTELAAKLHKQIKNILVLATDYGFDGNLWQNFLTFLIITDENPFTLTSEKTETGEGSVKHFVMHDFAIFRELFRYDFSRVETLLDTDCFSLITQYRAIVKKERIYNKNVSEKVRMLSELLSRAETTEEFYNAAVGFYQTTGVGMFGLNKAFRIRSTDDGNVEFLPINNMDKVQLSDLVGYEIQKKKLYDNTESFVSGKPANNVLLYGDSGTGKSTCIKAIVNEFYDKGLRMIEIYKHQFRDLSTVISLIKNRNYKFIIYMDDLSFEEFEIEYKFLKAVIEGGVESRPDNILIYATSNRRHLIKESWRDKNDMEHTEDMHHSDTMEEKLSLVNRFGVSICFSKPTKDEFYNIVLTLAERAGLKCGEEELRREANRWEMRSGGISGRTAQQFINYMQGIESSEKQNR